MTDKPAPADHRPHPDIDGAIRLLMQLQRCTETEARATFAGLSTKPPAASRPRMPRTPIHHHHTPAVPSLLHAQWRLQARCHGRPDVFFPPRGERPSSRARRENEAKKVCRSCPVLAACRQYALDSAEPHGIWGATTPEERARLAAAADGTASARHRTGPAG